GGMEYAGATITSLEALSHEVGHSWFGRGVIPAGGNAGWLDEAITSWRDMNFPKTSSLSGNQPMADHGPYNRTTDGEAYGFGAEFIGLLNSAVPNFFDFMRHLYTTKAWSPITTESFAQELSLFTGKDFAPVFKKYVFKPVGNRPLNRRRPRAPNPYHPSLTHEELQRLL
ncbi:MAG: hypothetical protein K2X47_16050, partial [Bdellovibrionales bacterium]|nr:hypothetical protein [Bdellovibrionales bacterium]